MQYTQVKAVVESPYSFEEALSECLDKPGTLFGVLDACDEPKIPEKVALLGDEAAVSLYSGNAQRDNWAIAPYLVVVDEQLLDWMKIELGDDPWGLLISSRADLKILRAHLRKFLIVEDPLGNSLYFRYYDPRVLVTFLRTSNFDDVSKFFGPVDSLMPFNGEGSFEKFIKSQSPVSGVTGNNW